MIRPILLWGEAILDKPSSVVTDISDAEVKLVQDMTETMYKAPGVGLAAPQIGVSKRIMPGKNGYEVCTYVRNHPQLKATPVILLVGAFDAFDEATAKQSGATANITKPFEPGSLIDLVMSLLPAASAEIGAGSEAPSAESSDDADLLGLNEIFKKDETVAALSVTSISEEEVDRIADRVIQKLSTQIIENIAWDVVPDITEKIVREELKKNER